MCKSSDTFLVLFYALDQNQDIQFKKIPYWKMDDENLKAGRFNDLFYCGLYQLRH